MKCIALAAKAGVLAAILCFGICSLAQTIITFDVPGSTYTRPTGMNAFGEITGYSSSGAFIRRSNGTIFQFNVMGSPAYPAAINWKAQVTGYYSDSTGSHGFVRNRNGKVETFDVPEALFPSTNPTAINAKGQITGYYRQSSLGISSFLRDSDGSLTLFSVNTNSNASAGSARISSFSGDGNLPTSINSKGQIAGVYGNLRYHSFLRQADGSMATFDVPTDVIPNTQAQAIGLGGQITGFYFDVIGAHGFLRQSDGTLIEFDVPGSTNVYPEAINARNQITGQYADAAGSIHGFVRKANGQFETFDAPGAVNGTFPVGINFRGDIVGYFQDVNFVIHGFVRRK